MSCATDHIYNVIEVRNDTAMSFCVATDGKTYNQKRNTWSQWQTTKSSPAHFTVDPSDFIGLEMSLVDEVESVFAEPAPRKIGFHIFTVVNDRQPEIRAKIYAREQAIMDQFSNLEFDFRIVARRGRPLQDIISGLGDPIFSRE